MELDQFKTLWQQDQVNETRKDDQLLPLLSKRSNNVIARLKRNLRFEFFAVVILYGLTIIYYLFAFQGKLIEISWFMLILAAFFIVYYYRKNKLLNQMECVACHVRSNLETQVKTLDKYIRFYLVAGTAMVPLTMVFFSGLIYLKFPVLPRTIFYPSEYYPLWTTVIAWVILLGVSIVLTYYLNKWYVRKLYGKHIEKLKALVNEMNEL